MKRDRPLARTCKTYSADGLGRGKNKAWCACMCPLFESKHSYPCVNCTLAFTRCHRTEVGSPLQAPSHTLRRCSRPAAAGRANKVT